MWSNVRGMDRCNRQRSSIVRPLYRGERHLTVMPRDDKDLARHGQSVDLMFV